MKVQAITGFKLAGKQKNKGDVFEVPRAKTDHLIAARLCKKVSLSLEEMTINELRKFAKEKGIEITNRSTKNDLIIALQFKQDEE